MARTAAKAKKQRQDVNKSKTESNDQNKGENNTPHNKPIHNEDTNDSADKENDNTNYEVEKIIHTRLLHGKRQYLVRWKGYNEDSDTWENESVLQSCAEALENFKKDNTLNDKVKSDSDDESEYEEKQDSDDEKQKGKKRTIKETKKIVIKKPKNTPKSTKKTKDKEEASAESEEEEEKDQSNDDAKKHKKDSKAPTKVVAKKPKQDIEESEAKKKNKPKDSDNFATDGKNYEVEKILEVHKRKDGSREFLIRWKGYRPSEDTWEPEAHLDCQELIEKFMEKVDKAKSIPARELRESRTPTNRYIPNTKSKGLRSNLRNAGFRPSYQE